jgi:hypothetical protein
MNYRKIVIQFPPKIAVIAVLASNDFNRVGKAAAASENNYLQRVLIAFDSI